jgi:hypothetical protein
MRQDYRWYGEPIDILQLVVVVVVVVVVRVLFVLIYNACLTGRSACQQGARHFVFIMGRIKLAQLSYLFLVTELIL